MWKCSSLITACVSTVLLYLVVVEDGVSASGALFHGFLPIEKIRASGPDADNRPNDIYAHIPARQPRLPKDHIVIYPRFFGFEQGKDSEKKVYEIHDVKGLLENKASSPKGKISSQGGFNSNAIDLGRR